MFLVLFTGEMHFPHGLHYLQCRTHLFCGKPGYSIVALILGTAINRDGSTIYRRI